MLTLFPLQIRAEAAYLYDAVHVYARALNETLRGGGDPYDGRALIASILGTTYRSAMGSVQGQVVVVVINLPEFITRLSKI